MKISMSSVFTFTLLFFSLNLTAQNAQTNVDLGIGTSNFAGPSFLFNVGTSFKHQYLGVHISSASQTGNAVKNSAGEIAFKYNDRFSDIGLVYGYNTQKNKSVWTYIAAGPSFYVYSDKYVISSGTSKDQGNDNYSGFGGLIQVGVTHPFKKKNAIGLTAFSNFTKEGFTFNACLTLLFGKFREH